MANTVATAYVQIEPTAKGISKKLEGAFSDAGDSSSKTFSGAFGSALGKVGGVLAGVGKVATGAIATAGTAVAGLTKTAVDSFADYEQLVGGVETLFKNSSGKVKIYANEAYKTSGLSANQYMEQVTSFSASLLQGLNGNTNKAADVANTAIKDMADNVNKMGTTQEAVQNAYNGLAKQNFTMLDNLKLGYQGTAAEMARLINDSGVMGESFKATAKNVKDISFDKYIEAIHVVQEEMGITGTTAKEASDTISGSTAMMKASWANLVTGIANDKADFGALMDEFVASTEGAFNNIMPRIEVALNGIADFIARLAPVIAEKIPGLVEQIVPPLLEAASQIILALSQTLPTLLPVLTQTINQIIPDIIKIIIECLPLLVDAAVQIIGALSQGIIDNLPELLQAAIEIITKLANDIAQSLPTLMPAIIDIILSIVDTLISNIDMLIDGAIAIIIGLAEGLITALPKLQEKIPEIIKSIVEAIITNLPELLVAALQLIIYLGEALVDSIPELLFAMPEILKAIVEGLLEGIADITSVGGDMVAGLWEGIKGSWDDLVSKVTNLGSKLVEKVKKFFEIGSPSKLFADEIGKWIPAGIGVGIEANADSMTDSLDEMVNATLGSSSVGKISGIASDYGKQVSAYQPGNDGNVTSILMTYLPMLLTAIQNSGVELSPDAKGIFNMVRKENNSFRKANGVSALV